MSPTLQPIWLTAGIETEGDSRYKTYIPRPETKLMVQRAIDWCNANHPKRALDVATGSGCIAITLKKHCPELEMTATDIDSQALDIARQNATDNQVDVRFLQGSYLTPVEQEMFDFILCNPPYVPRDEEHALSDISRHEPEQALFPDQSPTDLYQMLLSEVARHLNPGGAYLFEIGFGQFQSDTFDIVGLCQKRRPECGTEPGSGRSRSFPVWPAPLATTTKILFLWNEVLGWYGRTPDKGSIPMRCRVLPLSQSCKVLLIGLFCGLQIATAFPAPAAFQLSPTDVLVRCTPDPSRSAYINGAFAGYLVRIQSAPRHSGFVPANQNH